MAGPAHTRLVAEAAKHSMSISTQPNRLLATRVGPGHPRRLSVRIKGPATAADWEHAADTLADEIRRTAVPDTL